MLRATTSIDVGGASVLLERLCGHFAEHGQVSLDDGVGEVAYPYGKAVLVVGEHGLDVAVESADPIHLTYLKMGVVEHVLDMADGPVGAVTWQGDGHTAGLPAFFRAMRVIHAIPLTPSMQRVRLSGTDLGRFGQEGLHVGLLFPPKGRQPVWPTLGEDGRMTWPQGDDTLSRRVYTLRRVDAIAGLVDIDMVLHDGTGMPGSDFARTCRPGDLVGMTGPGGGRVPTADALLLVGDETALPAIARILEELPAGTRAKAVIEVGGPADEIALTTAAQAEVTYLHRSGRDFGRPGALADAVRSIDLEALGPDPFVWAGCEFADFKSVRTYLRKERSYPKDRHLVVAYWRAGRTADDARGSD